MSNITNVTGNATWAAFDQDLVLQLYYGYLVSCSIYIIIGTPICVWLISAILTSPDMRRSLRNQLVCMISLFFMLKATISGGMEMALYVGWMEAQSMKCAFYSFIRFFRQVVEFTNAWLVIILLAVFIAQVVDFDPSLTLTPRAVTLGKVVLFATPCILGVIIIPSMVATTGAFYLNDDRACLIVTFSQYRTLHFLDFLVPLVIAVALLVTGVVLYYRRFHRGFSSAHVMGTELIGRGPKIDNVLAYIVVVGVDIIFRFPITIHALQLHRFKSHNSNYLYGMVVWILMDSRTIFASWGWLFLADIRERIKIWRPWYRPAPGIDLSVTYSREEAADK